jgi:hypothetical protein
MECTQCPTYCKSLSVTIVAGAPGDRQRVGGESPLQ